MAKKRGKREKRELSKGKKVLRAILAIVLAILIIVLSYVAYVFISYYRIEDNLELEVNNPDSVSEVVPVDETMSVDSWNIGFAAYLQDYSFFMDGGEESRARSEEAVKDNMENITATLQGENSDFYLIQEVDTDATRSFHVDESEIIKNGFKDYSNTFAVNYDSPYLFYPILEPHGKSKAGILTLSKYKMSSSLRRSLPIQTDFAKLIDLDRCYDVVKFPTENGKELVMINLHLSAYTTNPTIADKQLDMLYEQIVAERAKGNYVICGGDFNKDLLGTSSEIFHNEGTKSWSKPFKEENIPEGFTLIKAIDEENPVPSCRDCDIGYIKGTTSVYTLDGFIISDNVSLESVQVRDLEFMYSDHNPVVMRFKLNG